MSINIPVATNQELIEAHDKSSVFDGRDSIVHCFYCLEASWVSSVKEFVGATGQRGLCPECGVDSLIPTSAIPVRFRNTSGDRKSFLIDMNERWFQSVPGDLPNNKIPPPKVVSDFEDLQKKSYQMAFEKGFWDETEDVKPNIGTKLMLIVSEISEAMEEYRKVKNDSGLLDVYCSSGGKPEGFGVELADAVIRIMDLAERYQIPLKRLITEKMKYNATRPRKHNKRV